jgi:hypothetical protein
MFLTGQQFENGLTMQVNEPSKNSKGNSEVITYHGKTIEVKDRLNRFRVVDDFIWNNPYRATSGKINSFYHAKD